MTQNPFDSPVADSKKEKRIDLALLAMHAVFYGASFPPLNTGYLAWVAFVPYFFFLERNAGRNSAKKNYLLGVVTNVFIIYWLAWNSGGNRAVIVGTMFGAAAILGVWYLIYGWAQSRLLSLWGWRGILTAPVLWVGIEYIRMQGALGFPWTHVSNTQTYYTSIIQIASVTGPWGLSLMVLIVNVLVFLGLRLHGSRRRTAALFAAAAAVLLVPAVYGWLVLRGADKALAEVSREIKVGLVQSNIDPNKKWERKLRDLIFSVYGELTAEAAEAAPDLIIWPETATPTYLRTNRDGRFDQVLGYVDAAGVPLLTGTLDYKFRGKKEYDKFNSAFFLQPGTREIRAYAKMQLVPFGERVPLADKFPFLNKLELGQADFTPGEEIVLFPLGQEGEEFSVQICFESVFPDIVRRSAAMGSNLFVIITNDAWFGNTSGPYQHAQIAVLRAVENRRSIARCANTGVSMLIDPYGRIKARLGFGERGVIIGSLKLLDEETFYVRHGDYLGVITALAAVIGVAWTYIRRRRADEIC